ncbi:inositol monophosphatase family protein [Sphingomonas morindae]|uniref:Inositol monophosphatase n=1 Tax=Sphingomonas morindae TaxID=1541170 RepID=A0ABY4X6X4_9SPHN|nr:inositol monophosphatase family protein [Sphingomonas morindae]USI72657.1 inositol monophosphatase [Sphingomonas morindae]
MHPLHAAVDGLMRKVGRDVVMRRFGALAPAEIEEKAGPDDLVTVADRESEARLAEGLLRILPGSHVVGEEGVAADAGLLGQITSGRCWVIDPIDGTANFAAGRHPFALMVALLEEGETVAGWILDPATRRMCHAAQGGGAYIDNHRVTARASGAPRPLAALATRYLPEAVRADVVARAEGRYQPVDIPHCAGEQYPRLILGANDIALFWRAMPWDHLPGALILGEAGGRIARLDGAAYRAGEDRTGLLAAASPALWDAAARDLFG